MQKTKTARQNQVRIIGGMYRSRKLTFPSVPGLRPTGDRIRETLFNWLAPYIIESRCLDLFAGSGALGIEALSRGAAQVTFIDASPRACEALRTNLDLIDHNLLVSGKASIICANSCLWLAKQKGEADIHFHIAFLDPPFDSGLTESCCDLLELSGRLETNSLVYVEEPKENKPFSIPANWQPEKSKMAGNVHYQLFRRL